jgi:hypothetical protein
MIQTSLQRILPGPAPGLFLCPSNAFGLLQAASRRAEPAAACNSTLPLA